jgi:hypothetical protein
VSINYSTIWVTEREAVLRERNAAEDAFVAAWGTSLNGKSLRDHARQWAADAHPLPRVTRPRVVRDPLDASIEWTVLYDHLHWRRVAGDIATEWMRGPQGAPLGHVTAELCRVWADLLANPNEDVEAES